MLRLVQTTFAAAALAANSLAAQEPGSAGAAHIPVDASALRPGRFIYELALTRDSLTQPFGGQTITFTDATFAGAASWLVLESRSGGGISALDSLVASRDAFHALHWGSTIGQARIAAAFARDSLYGATSSPLGRRTLVGPAPRGAIASEGMLDGLMQLAPIERGWSADATLLVADLTGTRLIAAKLAVEGEEEVTVPAGTFASWVVSLRTGNAEKLLWVSKDDRMVVKSSQVLPQLDGAVLERVLTRVDNLKLLPAPAVPLPTDPRPPAGR
jgi:hypothetical protein